MLLSLSVHVALNLTNIAGFTSCTSKLINDIGLKSVLTTEKAAKF